MNTTALYRVWTGPVEVQLEALRLTQKGLKVEITGTEHVFVRCTGRELARALHVAPGGLDWQRFVTKVGV